MNAKSFLFSVVLATTAATDAAGEETVSLSWDTENNILTFSLQSPDANHWRLESSADMTNWSRIAPLEVFEGLGEIEVGLLPENGLLPERQFFKAELDNSITNVLALPESPYDYAGIVLPAHLSGPGQQEDNTPDDNPVTNKGAKLGRVLFYDKKLSINNTVSCSSCHQQENGFSDPEPFSIGFEGGLTGRNSMGLTNAKFYASGHFFWDERSDTLEHQTLQPIQDEVEMGMDLATLVTRLQSYEYYQDLFTDTFGDSTATSERISTALSQFVRSILSYETKFDEGVGTDFSNFTAQEKLGRQIFTTSRGSCARCHAGPNFVGLAIENNGLEFPFVDLGVGGVTGNPRDNGKFKMSSLRNIEKTAPYMHDGRHATLEHVIDHYSTGIVDNPNLGQSLTDPDGGPRRLNFTQAEKDALIAFLKTLTDNELLTDPKYADPFE